MGIDRIVMVTLTKARDIWQSRHKRVRLQGVWFRRRCNYMDSPWDCLPLCLTLRAMLPSLTRREQAAVVDEQAWWSGTCVVQNYDWEGYLGCVDTGLV